MTAKPVLVCGSTSPRSSKDAAAPQPAVRAQAPGLAAAAAALRGAALCHPRERQLPR